MGAVPELAASRLLSTTRIAPSTLPACLHSLCRSTGSPRQDGPRTRERRAITSTPARISLQISWVHPILQVAGFLAITHRTHTPLPPLPLPPRLPLREDTGSAALSLPIRVLSFLVLATCRPRPTPAPPPAPPTPPPLRLCPPVKALHAQGTAAQLASTRYGRRRVFL